MSNNTELSLTDEQKRSPGISDWVEVKKIGDNSELLL